MEQILQFGQSISFAINSKKRWEPLFLFLLLFSFQSSFAQDIVANRTVSNTHHCSNGISYGAWLNFSGLNNYNEIFDGSFIEYDDGTAQFTGILVNNNDSSIKYSIDVTFSGRTFDAPSGSPKPNNCYDEDTSDWYYYTSTEGTLTGLDNAAGALIELERAGPSFQVGTGANVEDSENFNASGWLTLTIISQPTTGLWLEGNIGDFNIRLSGESLPQCDNITDGGLTGFGDACSDTDTIYNCPAMANTILDCVTPSGGSGDIEYIWLKSTTATNPPNGANDPDWTLIPGANEASYSPGLVEETTYFFRCSRRAGCETYTGEANIVTVYCDVCDDIDNDGVCDDDCIPETIVEWDLDGCTSYSNDGSNTDYSEFTPAYPSDGGFHEVEASIVYRELGDHSCTYPRAGSNGEAMCIWSSDECVFEDDDDYALRFEVTVTPRENGKITALRFFEKAPEEYDWIDGPSGPNNWPTKYGIRILKNGTQVYREVDIPTTQDWTEEVFDFSGNPDFDVTEETTFSFELRAYCRIGNGADQAIWDIDDFSIEGCGTGICPPGSTPTEVSGYVVSYQNNNGVQGPECLVGAPDRNYSNFYDHQDNIIVKFDDLLEPGSEYTIYWKRRDYTSSYPGPARLDIYESEDGVNFTFNTTISTSSTSDVEETVTVASNTMFLKLVNKSTGGDPSPDFKVDAIGYDFIVCEEPVTGKIGDFVWEDANRNGIQDDNESGIPGVFVFLEDEFGNPIPGVSFEITDQDGMYMFSDLEAGNYKVRFATPQDYTLTDQNQGGDDEIDSDASLLDGRSDLIELSAGEMDLSIDAGYYRTGPLPVELLSFTAKLIEGNKVQLDWITESEENNNYFVIERSTDGDRYLAIGTVAGNGTSSSINTYEFVDKSPFFGRNYYRLKQVDYDGSFDFSSVESVVLDGEELPDVMVYPNPTKDITTLRVVSPFEQDATVEITNTLGQVLTTMTIDQGANDLQIDLSSYQPGFYYVNIKYDGFKKLIHRVLKVED